MGKESDGTIISLLDEDGNEQEFEHLASLEYNGADYVALVPYFENPEDLIEDDGELVILKIVEEDGEEMLSAIEDEEEFDNVSQQFEKLLEDDYEIEDET
ncbi:MAG: DUF1292 domain-containing protein [Clostridia bacterium]|nr:DUF1292 domain-containing protein [Clostridia bacterium]